MKCKDCEYYCPFKDNKTCGICDKDDDWNTVFSINECIKENVKEHYLKTLPVYFQAIKNGDKNFEYRKNDRDFKKYDILILKEWDKEKQEYTGEELKAAITYVLKDQMGVADGYAILSIKVF